MRGPIVLGDEVSRGTESMSIAEWQTAHGSERRTRVRFAVSWVLYVVRHGSDHPIESRTKNFSCNGFYCVLRQPLMPSETVHCTIIIPTFDANHAQDVVSLECRATVLRVESLNDDNYGVACRIDDYSVVRFQESSKPSGSH